MSKKDIPADCFYINNYDERLSPRNREEAVAWQLHDDVRMLYAFSRSPSVESFEHVLKQLETQIKYYRLMKSKAD